MRPAGDDAGAIRLRSLIVVLWRAGLRISEALALNESDLDPNRGAILVCRGKGGLCCMRHRPPYVALRTMLRIGFCSARASGGLRAERALQGGRRFRSPGRERNIFRLGLPSRPSRCGSTMSHSTRRTCISKPARNSGDVCSIASGRRIAKPGRCRQQPRRWRESKPFSLTEICCAGKLDPMRTSPTFERAQHSSERNIGRQPSRGWNGPVGAGAEMSPWLRLRAALPVGALFCVLRGPTCGHAWAPAGVRAQLHHAADQAGVRRRFCAPSVAPCSRGGDVARGSAAAGHPAPARPRRPSDHVRLPTRDRQHRDRSCHP
jgi:hypothetical protein